jgi:hypothetical protein
MKRLIPAVAAVLAFSAQAQSQLVEPSFKDYVDVKPGDYAVRADAVPAAEILKHFPKGSNAHAATYAPDFQPRTGSGSSAEIQAAFPQPSFQDHAQVAADVQSERVAGRIDNRSY